jgi:DNA primase
MIERRIIIPCYNNKKELIAIQGRNLYNTYKYITISLFENIFIAWGLDKININDNVYVFEGVFDACFFKNSIATLGTSFSDRELKKIIKKPVFVFDNDFRKNKNVKNRIKRMIKSGHMVSIFPKSFNYKDVNEAIIDGIKIKEIKKIIDDNICSGNRALLKLEM